MPSYRVFGNKYTEYYTIVEAEDAFKAFDVANKIESHKWFELGTDDVIEATDVYLNEDTSDDLQLNI
jgi:hypothetical protein